MSEIDSEKEPVSRPASDERADAIFYTPAEAEALIPDNEQIHTFRQGGFTLIGADWDRKDILELFKTGLPRSAGPRATAMRHGMVCEDHRGYIFIETKDTLPENKPSNEKAVTKP